MSTRIQDFSQMTCSAAKQKVPTLALVKLGLAR